MLRQLQQKCAQSSHLRVAPSLMRGQFRCIAAAADSLRQTPLHSVHEELGAKMTGFGGWSMPVQYPEGIIKSHLHTREKAGLFDVSHMLGVVVRGADRVQFMESLCTADLKALPDGMGGLSVITNEGGGVIDDCIITNAGDHLYMVINAGHEEIDLPHMQAHLADFVGKGGDASIETLPENGILALQGPKAAAVLQTMTSVDLSQMAFMAAQPMELAGLPCFVGRSGYTGEDGFEISVPRGSAAQHGVVTMWEALMEHADVMPVGLGARDSLRLEERSTAPAPHPTATPLPSYLTQFPSRTAQPTANQAGLCLYGNDLDATTSPVEGSLLWVIAKRRRAELGSFVGSERILRELKEKSAARKRAGFVVSRGAPVREGTALMNEAGENVGVVTSGGFSPCLKKGIGMCYVPPGLNKVGTQLSAEVRGKLQTVEITKMPFVPQNYYRGA